MSDNDPIFYGESMCIPGGEQHEWRWDEAAQDFKRLCEGGQSWRDPDDAEWNSAVELN